MSKDNVGGIIGSLGLNSPLNKLRANNLAGLPQHRDKRPTLDVWEHRTAIAEFSKDLELELKLTSISPVIRAEACLELAEKQGVKAQGRLRKIIEMDASEKVKEAAKLALAKTGD